MKFFLPYDTISMKFIYERKNVMKVEKKSSKNLNSQKIVFALVAIIIIVVIIFALVKIFSKDKTLEFNDFEKTAIYGYLEDTVLDMQEVYQLSGASQYNELQIFQSNLKQALDSYFATSSDTSVPTSTILGMIDSANRPSNVDFHGVVVSDYEYNPETDSFEKAPGANANLAGIEADANSINYLDKKASVQKIEETDDHKYKVSFNIVNSIIGDEAVEATGEAIISLQDGELILESCTIND